MMGGVCICQGLLAGQAGTGRASQKEHTTESADDTFLCTTKRPYKRCAASCARDDDFVVMSRKQAFSREWV